MENIKKNYKSICDTLKLLSEYQIMNKSGTEDIKKMFQFDCVFLLSALANQDSDISRRERDFINDVLGIGVSDTTVRTFAHANSKFDINAVSETVEYICKTDRQTWDRLGIKDNYIADSIVDFYEEIGEQLLQIDNPKASLESLYHFIAIQKDYIKGCPKAGLSFAANRMLSDISRDFFGSPDAVKKTDTNKPLARTADTAAQAEKAVQKIEPMEDPMAELEKLVGLDEIKKDVKELINLVKIKQLRQEKGMKSVPVSLHLVFTGNPGTGKTTVARILAQLYKQIGVLEGGQLVETDRSGLVAGYVGQTAIKTQEMIKQAMGGVLFIDEAYSLVREGNDFGQEAIATILKSMEDNRDKFVVIVAGYDDLMENFINSNPGLKSRFNKYFHFPDYTADEMTAMFKINCSKYQYTMAAGVEDKVKEQMQWLEENKDENFANGRDVRNYFEKVITRQASRISSITDPSPQQISEITAEDL